LTILNVLEYCLCCRAGRRRYSVQVPVRVEIVDQGRGSAKGL